MTYNVKQAEKGSDCTLQSYQAEYEREFFWSCTSYKEEFGTDQLITVVTIGPLKQLDDLADDAPKLPLRLTAPASNYTVNEATPLIDQE